MEDDQMSVRQPLFGMVAYRPRHGREQRWRWWPLLRLLAVVIAVPVADTPAGVLVVSVVAGFVALFAALRWRWIRAQAKLAEILESELSERPT
ncbi:hypothetical protein ACWEVP_17935 [Amycolatopsis sp. NPDC003865]